MHLIPRSRLASVIAGTALLAIGLAPCARADKFPPLNTPASTEHLTGKLVWADLFTNNPDEATKFYTTLLGWTATSLDQKGKGYTVFSNNGHPVAGLAPRNVTGTNHPARWIGYFAVSDIDATLALVTKNGGLIRAKSHKFPDRGSQAIVADNDGTPVGLLQSSSGDSVDNEPSPGEWNWFELYAKNPKETGNFYHNTVGFDVAPETSSDRKSDFVLSSSGHARGGIAPLPDGKDDDIKATWLGVIRVANLDDTLAKVPSLGGEVLVAPHSVEYGSRFAIILDSTGGTVGLVQYMDNANPANSQ
jgi:uncharacterized protein